MVFKDLLYPVGDKQISIAGAVVVAVRRPHQFFAIGREHWKCVKIAFGGHLFKTGTIEVDQKEVKIISL